MGGGGIESPHQSDQLQIYHSGARVNLSPGGGGPSPPPQILLVPFPKAARYSAHTCWLFLTIHCIHFRKKCWIRSDQVRSGHQSRLVDPTSEMFAITSELGFFHRPIFPFQVFITAPVWVTCISHNLCMWPEVRIKSWYIHYKPMGK